MPPPCFSHPPPADTVYEPYARFGATPRALPRRYRTLFHSGRAKAEGVTITTFTFMLGG